MVAVLLAALLWSSPAPTLWVCNPGKTPASAPSNCEHIRTVVIARFRLSTVFGYFHLVSAPSWLLP